MSSSGNIFAVRTTIGQEKAVAEIIEKRVKGSKDVDVKAILVPESLNGYIFIEAASLKDVLTVTAGIPHVRGQVSGRVKLEDIEQFITVKSQASMLSTGDIVEVIRGPFKGEKATIVRVDTSKDEVVLELLESPNPIPIKVHADYVKLVERREKEEE
ncbi:MAG: transcription elongation factor Spt5 [Candidatus Jordarchaeales archaeon]